MKSRFVLTTSILVNRKSLPIVKDTSLIEITRFLLRGDVIMLIGSSGKQQFLP